MGFYPVSPGEPIYAITSPVFDKITIALHSEYYKGKELIIEKTGNKGGVIETIQLDNKIHKGYFINHSDLVKGSKLKINLK